MNLDFLYAFLAGRHRWCERGQLSLTPRRVTRVAFHNKLGLHTVVHNMSILSRIPNLISSSPSFAPQEAMIASQQAHINELVQKTRTLDNIIKDLQEQLTNSRAQWQAEHREWIDGCDSLMACHRIAHLRTNVRLAQERVALAHERDSIRRERIAVIQRDYNLILFKAREKRTRDRGGSIEGGTEKRLGRECNSRCTTQEQIGRRYAGAEGEGNSVA